MSWKDRIKQRTPPKARNYTFSVDFESSPHLYKWMSEQTEKFKITRSDLLRAVLQDAYDDDLENSTKIISPVNLSVTTKAPEVKVKPLEIVTDTVLTKGIDQ